MKKTIDLVDLVYLELFDKLQEAFESGVEDYSIFYIEDYKVAGYSYRAFHWVSTTREEDEPFVVAHSTFGDVLNKTEHTPSDLLTQLANISIGMMVDCIGNMEVKK